MQLRDNNKIDDYNLLYDSNPNPSVFAFYEHFPLFLSSPGIEFIHPETHNTAVNKTYMHLKAPVKNDKIPIAYELVNGLKLLEFITPNIEDPPYIPYKITTETHTHALLNLLFVYPTALKMELLFIATYQIIDKQDTGSSTAN